MQCIEIQDIIQTNICWMLFWYCYLYALVFYMCNICIIPSTSYRSKKRNSRFIVSLSDKHFLMQFVVVAERHASGVGFILAVDLSIVIILHKLHTGVMAT